MRKTAAQNIKEFMTPGRVYRRQELAGLSNNLARDLHKLVKDGELVRPGAGLYYLPEMTTVGARPAAARELVRAFLNDEDFLLTSLNDYNPLGFGLTQLYNELIVYNRKRHGNFVLDGRRFSFRRPRNFPPALTKEFLFVDVLNNRDELAEDTGKLQYLVAERVNDVDSQKLLETARSYGKVYTRKFFEELLAA